MLHYVETLPHDVWVLVWCLLIELGFPTLERLGFPTLLTSGADKTLDMLGFAMEEHPLYASAYEFPPEKCEIDGSAENESPEASDAGLDPNTSADRSGRMVRPLLFSTLPYLPSYHPITRSP